MMYQWKRISIFAFFGILLGLYQNFVLPEFPVRNVDTRTTQYVDGQVTTITPHVPAHDFSHDGRVALRRRGEGGTPPFMVMTPENVVGHLKDSRNPNVGANLLRGTPYTKFNAEQVFRNAFGSKLTGYSMGRSILCEKTESIPSPYVCGNGTRDCYRLTLINGFNKSNSEGVQISGYFTAVDVIVEVANPKTKTAYIHLISKVNGTERIGAVAFPYPKLAEPVVVGDGRLLVTRLGDGDLSANATYVGGTRKSGKNINIAYAVYPKMNGSGGRTAQCDPSQWTKFLPISHAYFDEVNNMKDRYKFARHPLRDSFGEIIPNGVEMGGSYPWMDMDAANLFFFAFGQGQKYYTDDKGVYGERTPSTAYKVPGREGYTDQTFEAQGARTVGISMAGFWTKGKTVLFDGLLNNADYNFRVSTRGFGDPTRQLRLYRNTPTGQFYEKVGSVRELGDDVEKSKYHPHLTPNSSFIGSLEKRMNYVDQIKAVTPRDVVWHFGSTRHDEELVFDDYINPYIFINAEMVPAVGVVNDHRSMRLYDGIHDSEQTNDDISSFPLAPLNGVPLAFQNAAIAEKSFMAVPQYGRAIGDVRSEPIAKGGIHGKGVWLERNFGIQFEVPSQSASSFDVETRKEWYVGVFVDPRKLGSTVTNFMGSLVSLSNGMSIKLDNVSHKSDGVTAFDTIKFYNGGRLAASMSIPLVLAPKYEDWKHFAFQFHTNQYPTVFVDGMRLGVPTVVSGSESDMKSFFVLKAGTKITLGSDTAAQPRGIKGWFDDFKVIARSPTLEEKCNYSRGTLIQITSSHTFWMNRANAYPVFAHNQIADAAKVARGGRFACFVQYGGKVMSALTGEEKFAHRKNLPSGSLSLRDSLVHEQKYLKYGQPRPDFSNNKFCLSCHLDSREYGFKELNTDALEFDGSVNVEDDTRRQPSQPDRWLRGIIPANHFGTGKPAKTLNGVDRHRIDQWVLGN